MGCTQLFMKSMKNGGSLEVILDKNGASRRTDSKERIPHYDGVEVEKTRDVSVRSRIFPSEQTIDQQIEEGPSKTDNGIVADTLLW